MTIPTDTASHKNTAAPLVIEMNESGVCSIDSRKRLVSLFKVSEKLKVYSKDCSSKSVSPIVQLEVSPNCSQQKVVDLLNSIREANISTVTFKASHSAEK